MSVRKIVLVVILGMFLSAAAFAQSQAPAQGGGAPQAQGGQASSMATLDPTPFFDVIDINKDGKVNPEEWKATGLGTEVYDFWDKDKKGYFTKEYMAAQTHPPAIDSNKDGKLSLDELQAFVASVSKSSGSSQGGAQGNAPKK
jgi:hypothetical protein